MIKIGDYIRWWTDSDMPGMRKSYAGTVIKDHPGWNYYLTVDCIDGKRRKFYLSTRKDADGKVLYEPEYTNFTAIIEGRDE